jgi:arabinose-5-phosphate isomerase
MSAARDLAAVGIGSMVLDRIVRVPRILGADEKGIVRAGEAGPVQECVGGVVLNHLGWAAALGLPVGIFGKQADDAEGRFLRGAMDRLGIARHITLDGAASSVAQIFVDDAGDRAIYMAPGATSDTSAEEVRDRHAAFIRRGRRLTTEVSQLPLRTARAALEIAREAGIPTLVDLDVPPDDAVPGLGDADALEAVLRAADVLKPSKAAARHFAPEAEDALALATALRARFECEAVVVTDGEAGCAIAAEGFAGGVPACKVEVVDTTGAGDAFLGGLLVALDQGFGWEDAARLANACGAACVERLGAFPEDPTAARSRVLELYSGPALALDAVAPGAAASGALALEALDVALEELAALRRRSDPAAYAEAARRIRSAEAGGGRVHVTGIGKPEHVARYGAALLASTGTPAVFLHGTEAIHGSAGQVVAGDVVIAVSNSGETEELNAAVDCVRKLGASVVAVLGAPDSQLARKSQCVLDAGVAREGGRLGLAPRASVAAEVLVLAALSALLESERGFSAQEYHARHPAGRLGRRSRDG